MNNRQVYLQIVKKGRGHSSIAALLLLAFIACASHSIRFKNADPVWHLNDTIPIPPPQITNHQKFDETLNIIIRRPVVDVFDLSRTKLSRDVNSMDKVPSSSWFNHRLGYRELSAEDLLRGPYKYGPPQPPLTVIQGKFAGLTPGFTVQDSRGMSYLFKFDPPDFPGIETAAAFIVNRLFWGFGYNVPEDYLFHFNREDLSIDPQADLTEIDIDSIFNNVAKPTNGEYRCTASRLLDGMIIGPFPAKGVREDDPNDRINHEERRILRCLKVFGAFTNYTDLRIENTMDVYLGDAGEGYVKHYFLDFGGSMGAFSADKNRLWEGSNYLFSFKEAAQSLLTAGLAVREWEDLEYTPWKSVGVFEAEKFDPGQWKETYPFLPIHQSQPADNYWAAKILGALSREQIEVLAKAAEYPEEGAGEYVVNTLLRRREKALLHFLTQVSPLEPVKLSGDTLYLRDMVKLFLDGKASHASYEIEFLDANQEIIAEKEIIKNRAPEFAIPVPAEYFEKSEGYLRIDVQVYWKDKVAPSPAQFHLIKDGIHPTKLVGVVH